MPQPYNYMTTPRPQFRGIDFSNVAKVMAERRQEQRLKEQTEQMQNDFNALGDAPALKDVQTFLIKHPSASAAMQPTIAKFKETELNNIKGIAMRSYLAAENGRPEISENILRQSATEYENIGDTEKSKLFLQVADSVKSNPKAAPRIIGMLSGMMLGKPFFDGLQAQADLGKTEAETQDKLTGNAQKIQKMNQDEEMDPLTVKEKKLQIKKLDSEIAKINTEAKALKDDSGKIPVEDRQKIEEKLMDKYTKHPDVADFFKVRSAYDRVKASGSNAAGDIALIFNYMKMLDPGSTVREGEFATAQNAGGVDDKTINLMNSLISGERLNDGQRKQFKGQAESFYNEVKKREQNIRKGLGRIADNYGLNKDNIFVEEMVSSGESKPQGQVPSFLQQYQTP